VSSSVPTTLSLAAVNVFAKQQGEAFGKYFCGVGGYGSALVLLLLPKYVCFSLYRLYRLPFMSAEMRFIRRTLGYTLFDHKRNELMDIMDKQLKTTPIIYFVTQYRKNWKEHVHRMTPDRIPKVILKYQPKEKRCLGRPLKRWQDSVM
jgi:hypothetical protein